MSSEIISIDDLVNLKPIECPTRGGVNFPCAVCKECEIGEVTLTFGDGVLIENTVNSILLHLSLNLTEKDVFEKYVLDLLKSSLSKIVPFVQKGTWEEGDVSILITDDKKNDTEMLAHINDFLNNFETRWRMLAVESKRMLKDWSDRTAKNLAHTYFKELADMR